MSREVTAADFAFTRNYPQRRPLSALDIETITYMAEDRRPRRDIARAIQRSHGTIATVIRRLRAAGVDAPRPAWWRE
jgi:IS30 family transposase